MYKKYCTRCYHSSYSSSHLGKWVCPTCSNDLTNMKAIVASNRNKLSLINNYHELNRNKITSKSGISLKI